MAGSVDSVPVASIANSILAQIESDAEGMKPQVMRLDNGNPLSEHRRVAE